MRKNNLVVAIYYHPEGYPPTLNAISELSSCFDNINLIFRPNLIGTWVYPVNVIAIPSGNHISSRDQEKASLQKKISFFVRFTRDLLKSCKDQKASCILLYDPLALLAYYLIRPFIKFKHKVWYHNHDVAEIKFLRKYSLGWFAYRIERDFLKKVDIFTLPTNERLPYFNLKEFKGKYFCIPNYPSFKIYGQFYFPKTIKGELRLIFQGMIGEGHGLEEIIPLLKDTISGYNIKLIIKGSCSDSYRFSLNKLSNDHGVAESVEFHGFSPCHEVPKLTATCHVGIGIFAKKDVMNQTLGTASNKLYEYAACGLPVIYLNSQTLTKALEKFDWAQPVELSTVSIRQKLKEIIGKYEELSQSAHKSFYEDLNFENHFSEVKAYVELIVKSR